MFDIFISYSTKEKTHADELCAALEEAALSCWMAPRNVLQKNDSAWAPSIAQAIRNARLMIILFSENSDNSKEVLREVTVAARHNTATLTVNVDGSEMNNLEYHLCTTQMIELGGKSIRETSPDIVRAAREILGEGGLSPQAQSESMLDIYTETMDKIGTATRSGIHSEGLWHKTVHCWFVGEHFGRPVVWFQQRSMDKSDFPGLFDITAGRHLSEGETDREAIDRIVDELGVAVAFRDVEYVGVRTYTEHIGNFYNREFNSVYLFKSPYALCDFHPNEAEVIGLAAIDVDEGLKLLSGSLANVTSKGLFKQGQNWANESRTIVQADFVPRKDDYYQKVFALAKALMNGEAILSI